MIVRWARDVVEKKTTELYGGFQPNPYGGGGGGRAKRESNNGGIGPYKNPTRRNNKLYAVA